MKYALVTGASVGIGRSVAIELGKNGYKVGLVARRKEKLEETKEIIRNAEIFVCDLSDTNQVSSLINKVEQLDLLVNVAGVWHDENEAHVGKDLENFATKVILDTYTVGLISPTLLIHGLLPKMSKGGAIINLSGTFKYGAKGQLPYYASKRAMEDLTIGLSEELHDRGIKINGISPADTSTEEYMKYFPEDALGSNTPEQVAKLVVKIAESPESGIIWTIREGKSSKDGFHK